MNSFCFITSKIYVNIFILQMEHNIGVVITGKCGILLLKWTECAARCDQAQSPCNCASYDELDSC